MSWTDLEVLITGGTGTLGKELVKLLIDKQNIKGIRIFSRDEFKQDQFKKELDKIEDKPSISFIIGDIRNFYSLEMASYGVDVIINCAAMKQVLACENNPIEAIMTNIIGSQNVLRAAVKNKVKKVMHVSTDKCVNPLNLYGMTKGVAEKLFIHGNIYSGNRNPHFSCCRYGNVIGSRGSVIPLFKEQTKNGCITITDEKMTRFWIELEKVSRFLLDRVNNMKGGEIFIPKMPSCKVIDIAKEVASDIEIKIIGIRQGEKVHEILINKEESVNVIEYEDYYIITTKDQRHAPFQYDSLYNPWILTKDEIRKMVELC